MLVGKDVLYEFVPDHTLFDPIVEVEVKKEGRGREIKLHLAFIYININLASLK